MREQSRRMALCAMMAALGTAVLMMGGLIPLATFCAPALAALALVPVQVEYGRKYALGVYVATAALGLILCADREAALVFACLGHYPAIRDRFNRIRPRALRVAAKLVLFACAPESRLRWRRWSSGSPRSLRSTPNSARRASRRSSSSPTSPCCSTTASSRSARCCTSGRSARG